MLALLHQVLRVVGIISFQTVGVLDANQVAVAGEDHQPVGEHLRVVELLVAQRHLALQFECRGVVDQYALALSDEYLV